MTIRRTKDISMRYLDKDTLSAVGKISCPSDSGSLLRMAKKGEDHEKDDEHGRICRIGM